MTAAKPAQVSPPAGTEPPAEHSFPALWPAAFGLLILLLAILPTLPEEYYEWFLPFAVPGLSVVMMVLAGRCRRWWWILPFVLLALMFNPIRQPSLGTRARWQLVDFAGAVLFLLGAYFIYPKPKRESTEES